MVHVHGDMVRVVVYMYTVQYVEIERLSTKVALSDRGYDHRQSHVHVRGAGNSAALKMMQQPVQPRSVRCQTKI